MQAGFRDLHLFFVPSWEKRESLLKTKISLAMGEREYSTVALRELVGRRALDLWQPDLIRLGGVEAWRDSADWGFSFKPAALVEIG